MRPGILIGTGLLLAAVVLYHLMTRKRRNNPPGPKSLPLVGNLFDMPTKRVWSTFTGWKKQYGDIVYLDVFGQPVYVLNSRQVCEDLLEKRSEKYSDRPRLVMLNELMGWDYGFPFMPYSPRWRQYRRMFHQYFNETQSRQYTAVQEQKTHAFLRSLLTQPKIFRDHIRLLFAGMIMDVVYGYEIKGHDDEFLRIIGAAMRGFSAAAQPGRFYVEMFPILKRLPSWLPGAGFKKQAAYWKDCITSARDQPAAYVREQMENGTSKPCVLATMMSKFGEDKAVMNDETEEDVAKGVSAVAYAGGADTFAILITNRHFLSAFEAFFLAMANHPECQQAAQAELDALLGGSHLPTFDDRKDLPYINAIVKEMYRWHVIGPVGTPHALSEDDEYEGYFLPKGSLIIANTWSFLHDPEIYPDPDTFNHARWLIDTPEGKKLDDTLPEPEIMFGYGRRVCPGRYFADNSLFLGVAMILAAFVIHPIDAEGAPIERCEEATTDEILTWPIRYNVSIKPRSVEVHWVVNETE